MGSSVKVYGPLLCLPCCALTAPWLPPLRRSCWSSSSRNLKRGVAKSVRVGWSGTRRCAGVGGGVMAPAGARYAASLGGLGWAGLGWARVGWAGLGWVWLD